MLPGCDQPGCKRFSQSAAWKCVDCATKARIARESGAAPMSILDKHPAPWKSDNAWGEIRDANNRLVSSEGRAESPEVNRLILAAPVLLEALECVVSEDGPRDLTPINLLIAWLRGDLDVPDIDPVGFLAWLRGKEANIFARIESKP
jgi:hypothetical protein